MGTFWKDDYIPPIEKNPEGEFVILEGDKKYWSKDEVLNLIDDFEKLCLHYQSNKDWFPAKKWEWIKNNLI